MKIVCAAAAITALATLSLPAMAQPSPTSRLGSTPVLTAQLTPSSGAALPNGASSVTETFGDWTVTCRYVEKQKQCSLSQVQANSQTGQRAFAIELRAPRDGKTDRTIIMPFGVSLESGAILKVDDKDIGKVSGFRRVSRKGVFCP